MLKYDCLKGKRLCKCLRSQRTTQLLLLFFNVTPFYLEKTADSKPWSFRWRYLAGIFLKVKWRKPVASRKTTATSCQR